MTYVIGIDPGPMTGIVGWFIEQHRPEHDVIQCSAHTLEFVLDGLLQPDFVMAVERFVVGSLAARSNNPDAGRITRAVIDTCRIWAARHEVVCHLRSAAEVKPWADDQRLRAAGLWTPTTGVPHARDAARHALFAAVKNLGMRDPLSKRGLA